MTECLLLREFLNTLWDNDMNLCAKTGENEYY
jgi:hypothetical protein